MSTRSAELLHAYKEELRVLLPEWKTRRETFHENARDTIRFGAQVGAILYEVKRLTQDEFWPTLHSLCPDLKEDEARTAVKAYHFREKNPELTDVSQLTFALSTGQASPGGADEENRDQSRSAGGDMTEIVTGINRVLAGIHRLMRTPITEWDTAVRRSVKEHLRPAVELYSKL